MERDDGLEAWAHHEQLLAEQRENDALRFDIARLSADVARHGGHPENAPVLERTLLTAAGFPEPKDERQAELRFAA